MALIPVFTRLILTLTGLLLLPILLIRAQPFDDSEIRPLLARPEPCNSPCFQRFSSITVGSLIVYLGKPSAVDLIWSEDMHGERLFLTYADRAIFTYIDTPVCGASSARLLWKGRTNVEIYWALPDAKQGIFDDMKARFYTIQTIDSINTDTWAFELRKIRDSMVIENGIERIRCQRSINHHDFRP